MGRGQRHGRVRKMIAVEAARLMVEEGVGQYLDAKTIAAHRILGRASPHGPNHHLPSNGEIREALLALVDLVEGTDRSDRLFAMRVVALEVLEELASFDARLIGSVATGHAREGSDIDVHVFADAAAEVELHLHLLGWVWEPEKVVIRHGGQFQTFQHFHLECSFPVELSVYEVRERRFRPRSSTDSKPIDRVSPGRLRRLLETEHGEAWGRYLSDGVLRLDGLLPATEFEDEGY